MVRRGDPVQHQLDRVWKQFQQQPPAVQTLLLLTPFLAAAVVVLAAVFFGGSRGTRAQPPAQNVASAPPVATPVATNEAIAIAAAPATLPPAPAPAVPLIVQTPEPTPEPTASLLPSSASAGSTRYEVANTGGAGASMRREPSAGAARIKVVLEGQEVEALGPTRDADNLTWRSVRDDTGAVGWIATGLLSELGPGPRPTATPAPLTIQVVDLTEAPARNTDAEVVIRTRPGTRCELRVFLYGPATLPREGLGPKTADDEGLCAWTWTVPDSTVPGSWRYLVLVGTGDRQISREFTFAVR